uniref:B30.2/SPRY domain-containing protein n=1 Tax=Steinernema glaseri TaxID=37863 RepID=A0A1I8AEB6_9BILA
MAPSPSEDIIASALAPVEELTFEPISPKEADKEESPEPYVPGDPLPVLSQEQEYVPSKPLAPSSELIKSVASILQNLYAKTKKASPEPEDFDRVAREVMDDLLDRVDNIVDEGNAMDVDKENDLSQYIDPMLLSDPRELMKRASDVLGSMSRVKEEVEYVQELPDPCDVEQAEDAPKELEFHGEPVPESDEEDGDALFAAAAGLPVKKAEKKKVVMPDEDEPIGDDEIELDYFNADLNMKGTTDDKNVIDPDVSDGFALMYGGVKTNYGFLIKDETEAASSSRYAFQVKIMDYLSIKHVPFEEVMPHDVRVGWSVDSGSSTMHVLGEAPNSFCFDMHGRKIQNFSFIDYGEPLETGDVVTTVLDMKARSIDFYKNDVHMGTAFTGLQLPQGLAIFPHIATKNCRVHVNFGKLFDTDEFKKPASLSEEPTWLSDVECREGLMVRSRVAPESKEQCTVLMMVGLPAVGKTTWVRTYLREHPEEHWILISTDAVSNAMTISGMPRRRVHRGRWDMVMGLIAKAVNRSLHMACRRKHNYIIDMTNVSRDTRRRRLTQFKDFQRKCVVVIPSDEDFNRRQQRQARVEGTTVPAEAMLELKAVMSIPDEDHEPIESVVFIEPPLERIIDAIKIVNMYNEEAKPWYQKRYQRGRRGGGTYGTYGDRRREKDEDFHRPPPQKVVITQHIRTNNITSRPRYEQS